MDASPGGTRVVEAADAADGGLEVTVREVAPRVLAGLIRRYGDFDACEDALAEALSAAADQWPREGRPRNPAGWLTAVASRRWIEARRSETARRRREEAAVADPSVANPMPADDDGDLLALLFLCCHPALTPSSQVALTLRAVGGLTTAEIARAFLVPEPTVAQRISRAKATILAAGGTFRMPDDEPPTGRLAAVLHVLYLVFTEGSTASAGRSLGRHELAAEAIRLVRRLHARLPDDGEVASLLALMLLTDARTGARSRPGRPLVPLADQDRRRWDGVAIAEGLSLVRRTLATRAAGPYALQAAIAAVHAEAARVEDTDWPQVLVLYGLLARVAPGPMVTLNGIVALAMAEGPDAGLAALGRAVGRDPVLAGHYRTAAVRAHLLEMSGDRPAAEAAYRAAALATLSAPERWYLGEAASRLAADGGSPRRPTREGDTE